MGDVLGFDFAEWMWFTSEELAMNDMMTILLFLQQLSRKKLKINLPLMESIGRDDLGRVDPREEMLSEEMMLGSGQHPRLAC